MRKLLATVGLGLFLVPAMAGGDESDPIQQLDREIQAALLRDDKATAEARLREVIRIAPPDTAILYEGRLGLLLFAAKRFEEAWYRLDRSLSHFEEFPGAAPSERTLKAFRDKRDAARTRLDATLGRVSFTSVPPGAAAVLETGVEVITPGSWWVPVGEIRATLRKPGFYAFDCAVTIRKGEVPRCHADLERCTLDPVDDRLRMLKAMDVDAGTPPEERARKWRDYASGPARTCEDHKRLAAARAEAADDLVKRRQAALDRLRSDDSDTRQSPKDRLVAWEQFSGEFAATYPAADPSVPALVKERIAHWKEAESRERHEALLVECDGLWRQILDQGDGEQDQLGLLSHLMETAPPDWQPREEARALLAELEARKARGRRFLPSAALGWGILPRAIAFDTLLSAVSLEGLRQSRPDFGEREREAWRFTAEGLYARDGIQGRGGPVTSSEDVAAPLPLSLAAEYRRSVLGQGRVGILDARAGAIVRHPVRSRGFDRLAVSESRFDAMPWGGIEGLFGIDPGKRGPVAAQIRGVTSLTPIDTLNASFPYPGGIWRSDAQFALRFGDREGWFDAVVGGEGSFRTLMYGSLPDSLYPVEGSGFSGNNADDGSWPDAWLGVSPFASVAIRPLQWLQVNGRVGSLWSKAPGAPGRTAGSLWFLGAGGGVTAAPYRDRAKARILVLDAAIGAMWSQGALHSRDPGYRFLTGKLVAAWQQPEFGVHAGVENRFDPAAFFGDFLNLWTVGLGGRCDLLANRSYLKRLTASVDVRYAPPLWMKNLASPLVQGDDVAWGRDLLGRDTRLSLVDVDLRVEGDLWHGILVGAGYRFQGVQSRISVTNSEGEGLRMGDGMSATHTVRYYVGYQFGN
jgi:hypothetical protein